MPIKVDVWGGDLHQNHISEHNFDNFADAATLVNCQIEAGNLCNVLHTDFIAPPERVAEQEAAMALRLALEGDPTVGVPRPADFIIQTFD
jgi:hypothetical protein